MRSWLPDDLHDGLLQALDLAIAEAGMRLAAQTGAAVDLAVTAVDALAPGALALHLADSDLGGARQPLRAAVQEWRSRPSDFDTELALVLADGDAAMLVRTLLGIAPATGAPLDAMESDALAEVANALLNTTMETLAHLARRAVVGSLPQLRDGTAAELFGDDPAGRAALVARVSLGVAGRRLSARLVLRMPRPALESACDRWRADVQQPVTGAA
jgi:chemotaxis protein CheY-P-specific phosphatase CheC